MKSTKDSVNKKVKFISKLLKKEISRLEIYRYCNQEFSIKHRQTDTYIKRAKELLRQQRQKEVKKTIEKRLNKLRLFLNENMKDNNDYFEIKDFLLEEIDDFLFSFDVKVDYSPLKISRYCEKLNK